MALQTEEVQIGDWKFRITQLPSMKALRMLTRLTRLAGPALAQLAETAATKAQGTKDKGLDTKLEDVGLGGAFAVLCDQLTEDEVEEIFGVFAEQTTVQTATNKWPKLLPMFDVVFAGRMDVALRWFGASLKINFASFLVDGQLSTVLDSLRGSQETPPGEKPQSPPASSG